MSMSKRSHSWKARRAWHWPSLPRTRRFCKDTAKTWDFVTKDNDTYRMDDNKEPTSSADEMEIKSMKVRKVPRSNEIQLNCPYSVKTITSSTLHKIITRVLLSGYARVQYLQTILYGLKMHLLYMKPTLAHLRIHIRKEDPTVCADTVRFLCFRTLVR